MTAGVKQDRGLIRVNTNECKGCGLCIEACPPKVIELSEHLNHYGYRTATYKDSGCTACGICFLACPEPGAITVLRLDLGAPGPGSPRTGPCSRGGGLDSETWERRPGPPNLVGGKEAAA